MRPTTSTTTNKKNRQQAKSQVFWKLRLWVPLSDWSKIQFNKFLWLVVSVVLPTQDIILNEVAGGESNLVILRSLFWRKLLRYCKFVIEKLEKIDWLIVILHHGYGWSRIYVKLWQVGPYSLLWTETEGRRIFLSETENDFTRRKLRNHETPRYW